jgi:exosortase
VRAAALAPARGPRVFPLPQWVPRLLTAAAFAGLFAGAAASLAADWWNDPDAGHGLLLAPLAVWLAWRAGVHPRAAPAPVPGLALLAAAIVLRWIAELAAELFSLRLSLLLGLAALTVAAWGPRQLARWWLPFALLALSVPLPDVVVSTLALPLQLRASALGAALLEWRGVPALLSGNVIRLPGHALFVTEACSGLRSLSALLSLGLLAGGLWLHHPAFRALLLAAAIPLAVGLNGVRVFLTGYLVHFAGADAGEGFMHFTEGWVVFVLAFAFLAATARMLASVETRLARAP